MQGIDCLEQTGRARARFEMADVTLDRAEGDAAALCAAEDGDEAFHLRQIAHARARAVRFDQGCGGRVETGVFPGATDGEALPRRVGRGDALAPAVAGSPDAADHGVDAVAVAFGVRQPFQEKGGGTFAHDEAVGALGKGAAACGAECADLAELDEGRRAHVAVHAAGNERIRPAVSQHLDRGADGGEAGGASGVGYEVGAAQIQHVGNASGDDVRQFAGHGIFGDGGEDRADALAPLLQDGLAHRLRQAAESRAALQGACVFGQDDALRGEVVLLAAHRRAEDHAGALSVERAIRVAIVGQRLGGDGDRPLLALVHRRRSLGRNAETLPVEMEAAHPTADLSVGLVRRGRVGVVIIGDAPALGRHIDDAVASIADVLPKGRGVGCVGENGAHPYDGDGAICVRFHLLLHDSTARLRNDRLGCRESLVQFAGDEIHVRQKAGLRLIDGGQI